jgi:hypothetical protein
MKIQMKISPFNELRYKTLGDYKTEDNGDIVIEAADVGDDILNLMILRHELDEYIMVRAKGIKDEDIIAFDEAHPDDDDPGLLKDAPYRVEHAIADAQDRIILAHIGLTYKEYDDACNKTWDTWKEKE